MALREVPSFTSESTHRFLEILSTDESKFELRPWGAVLPIQIFDKCLGNLLLADERYHDLVRLVRESSWILTDPSDAQQNLSALLLLERVDFPRAPCGLFAGEAHLKLRYQVGKRISLSR